MDMAEKGKNFYRHSGLIGHVFGYSLDE